MVIEYSFIGEKKLKKVSTDEFIVLVNNTVPDSNGSKTLRDLDLTEVDFSDACEKEIPKDFKGWTIENVMFSCFNPLSAKKKHLFGLSFKNSKLSRVSFAQAFLERCNFDNIEDKDMLKNELAPNPYYDQVDFFLSKLSYCRFCDCSMVNADFRYSKVEDCTMRRSLYINIDCYMCEFKGCTVFQRSKFLKCSFTNAAFENNVVRMENLPKGIVQDDVDDYDDFVNQRKEWHRYNPCSDYSEFLLNAKRNEKTSKMTADAKMDVHWEAVEVYKQLSGYYAGMGLNGDSNEAYRKMKYNERLFHYASIVYNWKKGRYLSILHTIGNIMLIRGIALAGFGYKFKAVFWWFVALVAFYFFLFQINFSFPQPEWLIHLSYSINNSLGPVAEYYKGHEFLGSVQSTLGVLLVGFLGFVVANKIRNSS
jgi:hypothetical protein